MVKHPYADFQPGEAVIQLGPGLTATVVRQCGDVTLIETPRLGQWEVETRLLRRPDTAARACPLRR